MQQDDSRHPQMTQAASSGDGQGISEWARRWSWDQLPAPVKINVCAHDQHSDQHSDHPASSPDQHSDELPAPVKINDRAHADEPAPEPPPGFSSDQQVMDKGSFALAARDPNVEGVESVAVSKASATGSRPLHLASAVPPRGQKIRFAADVHPTRQARRAAFASGAQVVGW